MVHRRALPEMRSADFIRRGPQRWRSAARLSRKALADLPVDRMPAPGRLQRRRGFAFSEETARPGTH